MQFHSNLGITAGYQMFASYMTTSVSIAVYSGNQPTVEEFCTNLLTSYTWGAGNNLLAVYGAPNSSATSSNQVTLSTNSSGITQLYEPTSAYGIEQKRAGTASWAAIFPVTGAWTYVRNNTATGLDQSSQIFMIVPVTDVSGNGVVRFSTTAFDGSTNLPIMAFSFTPGIA